MSEIVELFRSARAEIGKVILGQEAVIDQALMALFCEGHVLLEGPPGTAKTLLVRSLARILSVDFKRVQFTPDLMPSDVLGTSVLDMAKGTFTLRRGPLFTDLLLADEINRSPAKTQAALLQAMQERQVTIDGATYPLGEVFMVFATQNPVEMEGTYPLPEAQLDRFFFKIQVGYPPQDEEEAILKRHHAVLGRKDLDKFDLKPVADAARLTAAKETIRGIEVRDEVLRYAAAVARRTRNHPAILMGASPRGALMLLIASKAHAAMQGRDYVIPDDVKAVAGPALRHRLLLHPGAQVEGTSAEGVLKEILGQVEVPR